MDKLGGRKFIVALLAEIGLIGLLIIVYISKMLDMTFTRDWMVAFSGVALAFMGGNMAQHYIDKKNEEVK